ncbi:glutathione S-transferase [Mycena leptocephala]|nr:glutathione S-transferase [Mycena leptocephala]
MVTDDVDTQDDDGFILYESRAISRYLAEKSADQGTSLLPAGLKEWTLVEQAASVELANFLPVVLNVVTELVRKPMSGKPADDVASAAALAELSAILDIYEIILSKYKFLAGDEFTIADLFHLSYAPMLADAGVAIMKSTGPNVVRWWNDLIFRPAWIKLKEEGIKRTAT